MVAFVIDLVLFFALALIVWMLLILYVFVRVGYDIGRFKEHWRTLGGRAPTHIMTFLSVLALTIIVTTAYHLAHIEWFGSTESAESTKRKFSPPPRPNSNDGDERWTSNGSVRRHASSNGNVALLANGTHHRCTFGVDTADYDATGLQIKLANRPQLNTQRRKQYA